MITLIQLINIVLSLLVTSITFAVVRLLNYLHKKNAISAEVSRKVVHIGAGTLYLASIFYDDRGQYSKYLNVFPYLLWMGILIWKSRHPPLNQKHDFVIGTMTRNHRQSELLRGPLFFNMATIICGTFLYKTVLGSIVMSILTWGDGLAAIIGLKYGSQMTIYRSKTVAGFLTVFIVGAFASIIYISLIVGYQSVHLFQIILIALSAAITETLTPSEFDNLTIPLAIFATYYLLSQI